MLATIEPAGKGGTSPRAFLRVGGASLARHQLGLAMGLGCERVICIARVLHQELIALQHEAERSGMQFHVVPGHRELARLITATDELVVLSEGLIADPHQAHDLVADDGYKVLVQPAERGVPAGFERIDINNAAAGIALVPGRLVEALHELPTDCDVGSALTRIALQAGIPMREVPPVARAGVRWLMIRTEMEAYAIDGEWLKQQIGNIGGESPGRLIAGFGVSTFGSSLLHAGNSTRATMFGTLAAMTVAAGLAWLEWIAAAFFVCALAWLTLQAAVFFNRVEAAAAGQNAKRSSRVSLLDWAIDLELVLLGFWGSRLATIEPVQSLLFAPLVLILLLRLFSRLPGPVASNWITDRSLLSIMLGLASALGLLPEALRILSLVLLLWGLVMASRARLTCA